ncbi:MAG: hypothetical protein I3I98_03375 [Mobilibacterium timonense]|uniref:CocE/NonD family hydrolase n=1 Tax=Mobilibacterium timonense TaxID=1871012 RepID=UPI0023566DC0|nr:CocE/NonD family hydrolase [Mobilibacterium timonense]MBM6990436.1 hypothetical protein [Mobilibacterium timonense]
MYDSDQQLRPVFKDGVAQPVFPFTDGKTGAAYDRNASHVVRYCVYVETDFDMDGDGKRDLVKAFVQVPRAAALGSYKAPVVYEARPYSSGIQGDAYDHMKEVDHGNFKAFPDDGLENQCGGRAPEKEITTLEAAEIADPADWYYEDKGRGEGVTCYDNIDLYDYYLVRGYAVVQSAGIGTLGSEGFEYTGSYYERDGFKAVVEWLHGDRIGFADRAGTMEVKADWCSGKVAMTGRSYGGTMPFAVATTGVEGLETIVPVAGIADWYSFLNQQGAQRYWPQEMLMSFLSYYCSSRYNDPELTPEMREKILSFHNWFAEKQLEGGFDYDREFWDPGNYTLNWEKIRCSALIIHGFNDENVSTKQFEMMHDSFEKAGKDVKLVLHQGFHFTPTMATKGYGISVDGQNYDDLVNKWLSHYLFDQENGAENMPGVLAQDNLDQHNWVREDSWHTGKNIGLYCPDGGSATLDTDWNAAGIDADNFDEKMSLSSTNMNMRFSTDELKKTLTIQGTVKVDFSAALKTGNKATFFDGENANDADKITMKLGSAAGKMDDVKLTVLLCDVCDQEFESVRTTDASRNVVPLRTVEEKVIDNGPGLPRFDRVEFETTSKKYRVFSRAYIDLCNPDSGYAPETSEKSIELNYGEFHDYHCYLNATRYTLAPGHRLEIVIGTEDPVNCLIHKNYSVEVGSSVSAEVPVTDITEEKMEIRMI